MTDDSRLDRLAELISASPHNLVSRSERSRVRSVHVEESVAVAAVLGLAGGQRWIDLGTGGGLPGLALAVIRGDVEWMLVDATRKKVDAVQGFSKELGLANVQVVAGRAEALARDPAYRGAFDGVVSRAVGRLVVVAELARGFLRPGGVFASVKGPRLREELEAAQLAAEALGYDDIHSCGVSDTVRPTVVAMMRASGPVPPGIPRRDGIPQTQPLRGRPSR